MKRKQPQNEERRRRQAELNLLEESRRLNVRRRGCGPFTGSLLLLAAAAVSLGLGVR
jgi:hypothetical protein